MKPDYIVWKITESEEELRAGLLHPERFAKKIENLKPGSRRLLEILAVRRAMKVLFYDEEREVLYNDDGRPYLEKGPFISISHTNGYVAVITSTEAPVGIDIECRGDRVQKVMNHFLRREEIAVLELAVANAPDPALDFQLALHLAWSAKETAFKVLGRRYYDLQNLTTIQLLDWQTKTLLLAADGINRPMKISFDISEDYVLTYTY